MDNVDRVGVCTIEFECNMEEFERHKDASKLPGEVWKFTEGKRL